MFEHLGQMCKGTYLFKGINSKHGILGQGFLGIGVWYGRARCRQIQIKT